MSRRPPVPQKLGKVNFSRGDGRVLARRVSRGATGQDTGVAPAHRQQINRRRGRLNATFELIICRPTRAECVPRAPHPSALRQIFRLSLGAGEGIRTLDPNLGKVVLYP